MRLGSLLKTLLDHPAAIVSAIRSPRFSLTSYTMVRTLGLAAVDPAIIIDVGANAGQFTAAAAARWTRSRIVAFEPHPEVFPHLLATSRRLGTRVEVRQLALSDSPGTAALRLNDHSHSSSLLPLGLRHRELFPEARESGSVDVEVSTLDLEFPDPPPGPALLKLDVQGLELAVLRGAANLLRAIDHVVAEVSIKPMYDGEPAFCQVIAYLESTGFDLVSAVGSLANPDTGELVQLDLLFSSDRA